MRNFLKIVAINLLILLILLAIIDPWLGGEKRTNPFNTGRHVVLREYLPNINTSEAPSDAKIAQTDKLEKKNYKTRTDNNGFLIGSDTPLQRDSVDMIFFGGSTTACYFVEEDKRFPYLIEKQLNSSLEKKWQVANGGMSGNHAMHSAINLLTKGIRLRPKVVVLMHGVNDLVMLSNMGYYADSPSGRAMIRRKRPSKTRFGNFVEATTKLLIPNMSRRLSRKLKGSETDEWKGNRTSNSRNYEDLEKQYEQAIMSFVNIARAQDIEVILMTQFSRLHPDDDFVRSLYEKENSDTAVPYDIFCTHYEKFNEKIRTIAAAEDIPLIDLENFIPPNNTYIYDSVHLNDAGSELVAKVIGEHLLELNIK